MKNMEYQSLRDSETHFILFLLNGISDDNKDISNKCQTFLEDHGKRMREALKALGEDEDEELKTE
jgi:gas vesicle protein